MTITSHLNAISAALLFLAEKYRMIGSMAARFDDPAIVGIATTHERTARRIVATIAADGIETAEDARIAGVALDAFADELNRKAQALFKNNAVQEAAMIEHRVREVYAAAAAVRSHAVGLAPVTVA
jgi:hypothetical protein